MDSSIASDSRTVVHLDTVRVCADVGGYFEDYIERRKMNYDGESYRAKGPRGLSLHLTRAGGRRFLSMEFSVPKWFNQTNVDPVEWSQVEAAVADAWLYFRDKGYLLRDCHNPARLTRCDLFVNLSTRREAALLNSLAKCQVHPAKFRLRFHESGETFYCGSRETAVKSYLKKRSTGDKAGLVRVEMTLRHKAIVRLVSEERRLAELVSLGLAQHPALLKVALKPFEFHTQRGVSFQAGRGMSPQRIAQMDAHLRDIGFSELLAEGDSSGLRAFVRMCRIQRAGWATMAHNGAESLHGLYLRASEEC